MPEYTPTELAERVIELVALHLGTVDELRDWAAGSATGGFNSGGTAPGGGYFPFTAPDGFVRYVPCVEKLALVGGDPAIIEAIFADVQAAIEAEKAAAEAAAEAAITKAGEAAGSAADASDSKDAAATSADASAAARDLAESHRDAALAARDLAEDHRDSALLYRDQSQAAASAVVTDKYSRIGSKFDAEGFDFPASVKAIATSGYLTAGDGGHALYVRVAAQPAHGARLRSVDRRLPDGTVDAVNGGWWEMVDIELNARAFGARGNGFDDTTALQSLIDTMLATGRPGSVPAGVFTITDPLRINTTGSGAQPVCGFKLTGAGIARVDGNNPVNTAGTRIEYAGPATVGAPAAGIIVVEASFARTIIIEDLTLAGLEETATAAGGTTTYAFPVQNGIKFADTGFSVAHINRVGFYRVQRCVGVYRVAGGNGEHVSMVQCYGADVGQAFYCNHNQAYYHHLRDSSFVCLPNNAMVEAADPGFAGIGLSLHNVSGGFYPADGTATNILVKYHGGSTVNWIGGRIEQATQLLTCTKNTAVTGATVRFEGVEMTIPSGAERKLIEVLGNEHNVTVLVDGCNISCGDAVKRDLVVYAETMRGSIKIVRTLFQNVRNIIPHRGVGYLGSIDIEDCAIDGRPAGAANSGMHTFSRRSAYDHDTSLRLGSQNGLMLSGRRQNYLLESAFGFSPSVGSSPVNYTPPAPWVVTGNGGVFAQGGRWPHGFAEQPFSSACWLDFVTGQKVEQTLTGVALNDGVLLRYRAHLILTLLSGTTNEAAYFRVALVNDADPTIVYAEERFRLVTGARTALVDLKRMFAGNDGTGRLVIQNLATGSARLIVLWQHVTTRAAPVAFAPTTTTAVNGTTEWGAVPMALSVQERLQLPYKDDAFGVNGSLGDLRAGETYLSSNDDRLVTYANGKWKRGPVFDAKTGAPSSGSYVLGEVTFNSNPAAAGKAGWICVSAGSPGIHKPWGAIDA